MANLSIVFINCMVSDLPNRGIDIVICIDIATLVDLVLHV